MQYPGANRDITYIEDRLTGQTLNNLQSLLMMTLGCFWALEMSNILCEVNMVKIIIWFKINYVLDWHCTKHPVKG